jgi:6-methylsalicylate decarboxylase
MNMNRPLGENDLVCPHTPTRRGFLIALAALGAGALVPARGAMSQAPAVAKPRRIDIHHHLVPPKYVADTTALRTGENTPRWTPQMSIEYMDRNGIATSVTALMQPGVWFADIALGRRLARENNEYAAQLARDFPGRFGTFASLPLPDIEGSLREIEYALDVLKVDGFELMTSYGTQYPGDPSFWPVMEELNRRKAVVNTHPLQPVCCRNLVPDVFTGVVEYGFDTTRMIASVLFSGTAARFPEIRWIFSHSGGTMPFLVGRLVAAERNAKDRAQRFPKGIMAEIRKFHYDTAQTSHSGALAALFKIIPISQVMFGTDFPYPGNDEVIAQLNEWGFSIADRQAIDRDNALRLMPQLPS